MNSHYCRKIGLLIIVVLLVLTAWRPVVAEARANDSTPPEEKISLDFQEVELADLIKNISELTGRNIIYDDQIRGKLTILSPDAMSPEEAYELFLSALSVKGYTLVDNGKVSKIVSVKEAKEINLPVSAVEQGENYVTQLIRLTYADAQELAATVLQPLLPKTSNLSVYLPTNTLIVTDNAANIKRLRDIITTLDRETGLDQLEVFQLVQADAEEVAEIANALFNGNQPDARPQNAKLRARTGSGKSGQVIAYPRTNTLLAIASADEISLLRNLIAAVDQPSDQKHSNINVYYLKNADAEDLAKTLNEIMTGVRTAPADQKTPEVKEPLAITADKPTNSLLISAGHEDYRLIQEVIRKLDIRRRQVYVEALILELSMDATSEIGISLQGAIDSGSDSVVLGTGNLNTGSVGLGDFTPVEGTSTPSLLAQTVQGLMLGGLFNPITTIGPDGSQITVPALSALIQLSKTSNDVNILSAPRLLTSDNEEAEIIIGSNVPIITNRLTDTSNPSAQSVSVERKDVALTLRFTPHVTEGNLVRMDVFQEITDISSNTVGNVNEVGPTLIKRQLHNTVLAEDGKTVTLGGLIGTNVQNSEFKVPLLGDLPLLGGLFRSKGAKTQKTNLLVFITPRIIHDAGEMFELTRRAQISGRDLQTKALLDSINDSRLLEELAPGQPLRQVEQSHE